MGQRVQRVAAYAVIIRDGQILLSKIAPHISADGLWTLPGGGLDHGEDPRDAVVREVHEETGLRCALSAELSPQDYIDRQGRPKTVRWWAMTVLSDEGFTPLHEVDEVRWVTPEQAERVLTYEHDRELVREALATAEVR